MTTTSDLRAQALIAAQQRADANARQYDEEAAAMRARREARLLAALDRAGVPSGDGFVTHIGERVLYHVAGVTFEADADRRLWASVEAGCPPRNSGMQLIESLADVGDLLAEAGQQGGTIWQPANACTARKIPSIRLSVIPAPRVKRHS